MNERQVSSKDEAPSKEFQAETPGVENYDALNAPPGELFADPTDYSAVGGPESEPAYGRTRSLAGEYPFSENGGTHDRDEPSHLERGGIQTHHHVEKRT